MSIVANLLAALPGLSCERRAFLLHLFGLWPCVQGRLNLLHFSRHSPFCERTFRRHFAQSFEWVAFNLALAQQIFPPEHKPRWMLAYDHSFVPKSGKKTPGLGCFYNGTAGRVERGLELGLLALVELGSKTAFALHAKQTHPSDKSPSDKSPSDKSVVHLRECASFLPQGVAHLAVDGAFARRAFVDGACGEGLEVVSKLRADANLRYLFTGEQKPKGRPKLYDGKVNWKALDTTRWECEDELAPGVELYRAVVYHWSLKRQIVVALLLKTPLDKTPLDKTPLDKTPLDKTPLDKTPPTSRVLLFSTDLALSAREIVELYRARFQIEFLFRDAKSGAGLLHCQSRTQEALEFHFNAAFTALNLARLQTQTQTTKPRAKTRFSWASCQQKQRNEHYLQLFSVNLGLDWNGIKSLPTVQSLLNYGVIQP